MAEPPVGPQEDASNSPAPEGPDRGAARRARTGERVERARAAGRGLAAQTEQARLTARRLFGFDRSGPPPPETLAGHPLNPWTLPNAIGIVRLALIPTFLVLAYTRGAAGGVDSLTAAVYFVAGIGDYADGFVARITGQYSRLGALIDPITDRLVVISGAAVCWSYELLPRWAIAVLLGRELVMLVVGQLWIRRGLELRINWAGRIAVGPTMFGIFLGMIGVRTPGEVFLYAGLTLAIAATVFYFRSGMAQLRARRQSGRPASGTPPH